MSLNDTPSGERTHIGFFGRRNAGKSSVMNAVTGQSLSVVSSVEGTTTDPVKKAMELLPLGPVLIIDTPGFDDEGALGQLRVEKTLQILAGTDIAVLVVDGVRGPCSCDRELLSLFAKKEIPCLIAVNKTDLAPLSSCISPDAGALKDEWIPDSPPAASFRTIPVSAKTGEGIFELKEAIAGLAGIQQRQKSAPPALVSDLIKKGDQVILVIPIDKSAPKGRLILPQQQVIRDILDSRCTAVCVQEDSLKQTLESLLTPPALVITDSQVFARVQRDVPESIPLTSFSILMARYKGFLQTAVRGAEQIDRLKEGDRVLIAEGCTHHRQCEDIGTVKLPRLLEMRTGLKVRLSSGGPGSETQISPETSPGAASPNLTGQCVCTEPCEPCILVETSSGTGFPQDLSPYSLIIHCGGCMLNGRQMQDRIDRARSQKVPVTNYGTAIAFINGILSRSIAMLPGIDSETPAEAGSI